MPSLFNSPLNIAVLYGGDSAEREVSLNSGKAVAKGLSANGHQVTLFDTKDRDLAELTQLNIDCAFIALHGRGGEDGCIQGALEYLKIPYTGSKVLGSALSMDKSRSKQIFTALGLPTAPFAVVEKSQYQQGDASHIMAQLNGKVMVKPAHEGSSIGMAKAENAEQLHDALNNAFGFDEQVLVESWISGPEYTVTILDDQALPAIHMETPNEFYDYQAKYQSNSTQYHCPCHLSDEDENALGDIAVRAFKATNGQGWGRVDVMRTEAGQWQILEVNTVPGMTETSLVPKSAKVHGLSFEQLVEKIVFMSVGNK